MFRTVLWTNRGDGGSRDVGGSLGVGAEATDLGTGGGLCCDTGGGR